MTERPLSILVVEDDVDTAAPIQQSLSDEGHDVAVSYDGAQAMHRLRRQVYDLVISDVRLPGVDGLSLLRWLERESPNTTVIMMSAYGSVSEAVGAVREHAFHYLSKPFELDTLLSTVGQVASQRVLNGLSKRAPVLPVDGDPIAHIVGNSPPMLGMRQRMAAIGASDAPVLIHGESGTGKELVARALHSQSARAKGPFVAVNCAALPETLFEAELFGHERGAYTGASQRREGRFRAAQGGTLLLDEVSEMPMGLQVKLLRTLEEGKLQRLGSNVDVEVDARVLSATNADLRKRVEEGAFREDLYYRLKVLEVRVPPLRERVGDLPLLVSHFLRRHVAGTPLPTLSAACWAALHEHSFPGNVRELEHAIQHAVILSAGDQIGLAHLPEDMRGGRTTAEIRVRESAHLSDAVAEFEREYVLRTLQEARWNRTEAARRLGISRKNLWEKAKRYGIRPDEES